MLETLVELDRLLDDLPRLAKEAFLLAQLDGLAYAEIAAQLGISLSSVKRYMLKAAQRCYFAES
ncbi:putative RNA polymerase sigma factor FecI [compost metagenome]